MGQHTQLFYRLEAAKTMKAYIAHNMDNNEELYVRLKTTNDEIIATRKLANENRRREWDSWSWDSLACREEEDNGGWQKEY